ncbi:MULTISPECIES: hypothetical protein [Phaeobacter]|uniref:hypothetical protein n=1 Tax=Phaeobacter TaxID=302485 RepID=UPI00058D8F9E|nr:MULTISPECIES: hypothetical protein [Phaeobacter]AUQ89361.1 hypothetical protein PhaeoP24_00715 [Phaeobacter inhibens]KII12610.1 hypothetical protein OO25_17180 [Phaeobacter sp. S60]
MAERDYVSTPVSDELNLKDTILGLSQDLKDLRAGRISPAEAHARAAVAKQIWNGARIYQQAIKTMMGNAKPVPEIDKPEQVS